MAPARCYRQHILGLCANLQVMKHEANHPLEVLWSSLGLLCACCYHCKHTVAGCSMHSSCRTSKRLTAAVWSDSLVAVVMRPSQLSTSCSVSVDREGGTMVGLMARNSASVCDTSLWGHVRWLVVSCVSPRVSQCCQSSLPLFNIPRQLVGGGAQERSKHFDHVLLLQNNRQGHVRINGVDVHCFRDRGLQTFMLYTRLSRVGSSKRNRMTRLPVKPSTNLRMMAVLAV